MQGANQLSALITIIMCITLFTGQGHFVSTFEKHIILTMPFCFSFVRQRWFLRWLEGPFYLLSQPTRHLWAPCLREASYGLVGGKPASQYISYGLYTTTCTRDVTCKRSILVSNVATRLT